MKKIVILLIGFLLFINAVSADYNCSTGSMNEDQKEINIYNSKQINGASLGLVNTDETAVMGKYFVKIITDSAKFTLTNETNSTDLEMKSGTDTISLINITSNYIEIKVDSDSEELNLQETEEINKKKIFLTKVEGVYPGDILVEGILGKEEVMLSNTLPTKVITIKEIDYLLELFSASDNNAIIIVKKCDNESSKIIEIVEQIIENITIENETISEVLPSNETLKNGTAKGVDEKIFSKQGSLFVRMKESNVSLIILIVAIIMGFIILWIFKVLSSMQPQIEDIGK